MARKGGRRGKHGPNRSATRSKQRPLQAVKSTGASEDDDLIGTLRTALRSNDPTAFTTLISSMLAVSDAWWREDDDPDADLDDDPDPVPLDALIELFVRTPYAETTAALHIVAALLPDELDATRVRRALMTRRHPVPLSVTGVRDIVVEHAAKIGDELGDGDNLILGLTWPGIGGVTAVIYVDEAFGTRIKDVFLVPEPFDEVCARYRELLSKEGRGASELAAIALGDARTSVQHAIDLGDAPDALPSPTTGRAPMATRSAGPRRGRSSRCCCAGCRVAAPRYSPPAPSPRCRCSRRCGISWAPLRHGASTSPWTSSRRLRS